MNETDIRQCKRYFCKKEFDDDDDDDDDVMNFVFRRNVYNFTKLIMLDGLLPSAIATTSTK